MGMRTSYFPFRFQTRQISTRQLCAQATPPSCDESPLEVIVPDSDDEVVERRINSENEGGVSELMIGLTPMPAYDAGAHLPSTAIAGS